MLTRELGKNMCQAAWIVKKLFFISSNEVNMM